MAHRALGACDAAELLDVRRGRRRRCGHGEQNTSEQVIRPILGQVVSQFEI
jgi:hypothetical protein